MRQVTIPDLVQPHDGGGTITFAQACRTIFAYLVNEMDALMIIGLSRAIEQAAVGSVVLVPDAQWALIAAKLRRPAMLPMSYVLAAETHLRAWLDAPLAP